MSTAILESIYKVVDSFNSNPEYDFTIDKNPDSVLFGGEGRFDSLGMVNFIVAVEQQIEDDFNKVITLVDERAMSMKNSPFRNVQCLVDYISVLIKEGDRVI